MNKIDNILLTNNLERDINSFLAGKNYSKIFIIVDENTKIKCLPHILFLLSKADVIEIKSGDENKNIETAIKVWRYLVNNNADRQSLIINLGGGVVCDLGGFIASTFKRGISFINIPTTLLSQVDASIGGKNSINFDSIKNEVGTFNIPEYTFINYEFLKTLDKPNFLSGFAEVIKHSLIFDKSSWIEIKSFDIDNIDYNKLGTIIQSSIEIKKHFVKADPFEKNIRKALNFGHTIGHALESMSITCKKPILHGFAVAYGMIYETKLSVLKLNLDETIFDDISKFLYNIYGKIEIEFEDYDMLYNFLLHDKKTSNNLINFTLLEDIGKNKIDNFIAKEEIFNTFAKI